MLNSGSIGYFTGFKAHEFVAHTRKTNCVAVGPRSGQVLATGGDDKARYIATSDAIIKNYTNSSTVAYCRPNIRWC